MYKNKYIKYKNKYNSLKQRAGNIGNFKDGICGDH